MCLPPALLHINRSAQAALLVLVCDQENLFGQKAAGRIKKDTFER
jgi:hypothetical protein